MNYADLIMPNGEKIRMERWAIESYYNRVLCDFELLNLIYSAVRIEILW